MLTNVSLAGSTGNCGCASRRLAHDGLASNRRGYNLSFKTASLSFDTLAGSALIGQALGIRIGDDRAGGGQFDFDNVRLTETISAVPLPLPVVLLGSALAGMFAVRRRVV